ncbi:MAG: glycogen/starch synthase [Elusimicrobia bacterium]|nr:glycogen/starch synthase [Elusimicrobiota bacterium]
MTSRVTYSLTFLLACGLLPAGASAAAVEAIVQRGLPVNAAPAAAGSVLAAQNQGQGLVLTPLSASGLDASVSVHAAPSPVVRQNAAAPQFQPAPSAMVRAAPQFQPAPAAIPQSAPLIAPAAPAEPAPAPLAAARQAAAPPGANGERAPPAEEKAAQLGAAFDGATKARPLSIIVAGAEAVPFVKTGGLADVVDAVSRGLAARGHDVTLILPDYRQLRRDGLDLKPAGEVFVPVNGRMERALLLQGEREGVRVVLIHHAGYYDRDGGPYSGYTAGMADSPNDAYDASRGADADERFGFYSRAVLEAAKALGIRPDVVHAHDWHAALIPAFLKLVYQADPFFAATRTVLTIHNIAYQGVFGRDAALKLGFSAQDVDSGPVGRNGDTNFLHAGVALADAVTTVSPTYAKEIRGTAEFGMGLEGALNARPDGVSGILNGVDPALNDPRTDEHIVSQYGTDDAAAGKAANKAELQRRLGLDRKPDAPLFVVASRLAEQKGIDLVVEAAEAVLRLGGQLAITGSGDKELEAKAAELARAHPGQVAVHPFDEIMVHLVYAAGDFLLMPSRFEPCGLSQLIAQRFGTLPLVTRTGGLADTVTDLRANAERGDGFFIQAPTAAALAETIAAAVKAYRDPALLARARRTAMEKDSSWGPALDAYEALLRRLVPR